MKAVSITLPKFEHFHIQLKAIQFRTLKKKKKKKKSSCLILLKPNMSKISLP